MTSQANPSGVARSANNIRSVLLRLTHNYCGQAYETGITPEARALITKQRSQP